MEYNNVTHDKNINAICTELNEYIMERFGYKTPPAYRTFGNGTNIMVRSRVKLDLYLRFYYPQAAHWPAYTIVIARLRFLETRKGNGTHFLKFLKNIALKYDFIHISLESTNENSSAFAEHFNFKKVNDECNDYIITARELNL